MLPLSMERRDMSLVVWSVPESSRHGETGVQSVDYTLIWSFNNFGRENHMLLQSIDHSTILVVYEHVTRNGKPALF